MTSVAAAGVGKRHVLDKKNGLLMVNNLQSKNMCVQLQETQLYVNFESQNKAHIWLVCKQMLRYLHWTILSPVSFRVMNEKLHYNFTALDNLMDLLWENKLIPGKSSSVSSLLATSV